MCCEVLRGAFVCLMHSSAPCCCLRCVQELTLEFPNIVNPRKNMELKVGGWGWVAAA